jgi:hypothetical protein
MRANHLDDEAAFCLVWAVENADFAAVDGSLLVARIEEPGFENGE